MPNLIRIDVMWSGDGYTAHAYHENAMMRSFACGVCVGPETADTYAAAIRDLVAEIRWQRNPSYDGFSKDAER